MSPRELGRQLMLAKAKQLTEWSQASLERARELWAQGELDDAIEAFGRYRREADGARKFAGRAGEYGGAP